MKGTFRSLNGFNYRMWVAGAIVSNVGTWMPSARYFTNVLR
jgi:hypothetical protein